ncbi:MaoC/PaaZ C-terminal domain-containing protein [Lederbergia citrea]|uniref:MaoC family dehydratase N-terminal domain-containing protein n=1 Tax=Lederbergia citrea TaxID=2833581 RepID=A0A942Z4Z2_9BACI|nr:MaoC/PaaZ C-terminal domain-containing protein [Lederbergia citrea]MBS4224189.1 MaoC family dehydratase N-terminal domain-containing protein [Lederbergia citrea]
MRGIYFDEFEKGNIYITATRTMTETDVVNFSAMSGDMNELHTSEEFAKQGPFGKRLAQGLLGLSITHGLMFRLGIFDGTGIALLGVDQWEFTAPIYLGDTIHAEVEVQEMIESKSKPDRGVIRFFIRLVNQEGVITQKGIQTLMIKRKVKIKG